MTQNAAVTEALENIYMSINGNNENLDQYIGDLKKALNGGKDVTVDVKRIPVRNRQGRKLMQSVFKKRGILLTFGDKDGTVETE